MQDFQTKLATIIPPHRIKHQEPMAPHTSFHTGGFAEYYCEVDKISDLMALIKISSEVEVPVTVIGGGSNVIVSDNGIEGLVIKNNCRRFEMISRQGKVRNGQIDVDRAFVYCESGALTNHVVRSVIEQGFAGIEYALGLPGTIGGAIATNAEYVPQGFSMSDSLYKARVLTKTGEIKEVEKSYFHFDQGYSNISSTGDILLSVMLVVVPGHKTTLWEKGQEAAAYRTQEGTHATYGTAYFPIMFGKSEAALKSDSLPSIDQLFTHAQVLGLKKGNVVMDLHNPRFFQNTGDGTSRDLSALISEIEKKINTQYSTAISIQINKIGV